MPSSREEEFYEIFESDEIPDVVFVDIIPPDLCEMTTNWFKLHYHKTYQEESRLIAIAKETVVPVLTMQRQMSLVVRILL